jgi:superfamily II DNA helicase RecQ
MWEDLSRGLRFAFGGKDEEVKEDGHSLRDRIQSTIIYCTTVAETNRIVAVLSEHGITSRAYHAQVHHISSLLYV